MPSPHKAVTGQNSHIIYLSTTSHQKILQIPHFISVLKTAVQEGGDCDKSEILDTGKPVICK